MIFLSAMLSLAAIAGAHAQGNTIAHSQVPLQTVLHVRGEAELKVAPNQVTIILGVSTQNKTSKNALRDNSRLMSKIISALNEAGIGRQSADNKEITTQRFNIQPIWSSRPRALTGSEEWKPSIISYRVNNTIKVVTAKLDIVGDLIAAATMAGANQVQSIDFGLSNPREHREAAIEGAIENAKIDAGFVAKASGLKVSAIKTIHLDNSVASTLRVATQSFARTALSSVAETSARPPINSDDIIVRASVSLEYLLSKEGSKEGSN
jgi:uncharacterized protein YggE